MNYEYHEKCKYILRARYTNFIIKIIYTILGEHENYYYETCCTHNVNFRLFFAEKILVTYKKNTDE